jgi:hypothetical protein
VVVRCHHCSVPPQPHVQPLGRPHSPYVVASPSLPLRRRCLTHPSSASSGAMSSAKCPTSCVGNSVRKRFVASWLDIPLTHPVPRVQSRDSPHHHLSRCCLP